MCLVEDWFSSITIEDGFLSTTSSIVEIDHKERNYKVNHEEKNFLETITKGETAKSTTKKKKINYKKNQNNEGETIKRVTETRNYQEENFRERITSSQHQRKPTKQPPKYFEGKRQIVRKQTQK